MQRQTAIKASELSGGKRFWYGLGGFFGTNFIINVCGVVVGALGTEPVAGLLLVLVCAVLFVRWFYVTRKHESTQTGIIWACIIQAFAGFAALTML